jgi:hypothetical protein
LDDPTFLGNAWGVCEFAALETGRAEATEFARQAEQAGADSTAAAEAAAAVAAAAEGTAADTDTAAADTAAVSLPARPTTAASSRLFDTMAWLLQDAAVLGDFQAKLEAEYASESLLFYRATLAFDQLVAARDRAPRDRAPRDRAPHGDDDARDDAHNSTATHASVAAARAGVAASGEGGISRPAPVSNHGEELAAACYSKALAIFNEFVAPNSVNQVCVREKVA